MTAPVFGDLTAPEDGGPLHHSDHVASTRGSVSMCEPRAESAWSPRSETRLSTATAATRWLGGFGVDLDARYPTISRARLIAGPRISSIRYSLNSGGNSPSRDLPPAARARLFRQ